MAGLGQGLLWDGNVCGLRVLATRGSSREGLMVTVSPVEQLRVQREAGKDWGNGGENFHQYQLSP